MAEANWYWAEGEQRNGPVAGSAIAKLVASGKLGSDDLIWKQGMANWIEVKRVPALMKYIQSPQPAEVTAPTATGTSTDPEPIETLVEVSPDAVGGDLACPHCSTGNITGSQYCQTCGMALPIPSSGPRIVDRASFASTAAGQQLQADELHKLAKRAASALLIVAVIQTILVAVGFGAVAANGRAPMQIIFSNAVVLRATAAGVIFWGLFFWSRKQPLPAAIVGLVLYVTLKAIEVVGFVTVQTTPRRTTNVNTFPITWGTIVIIAVLCSAISAGLKYRKMQGSVPASS